VHDEPFDERARSSCCSCAVTFRLPSSGEQRERLPAVLHVLYLIFNEGYTSSDGAQLQRSDLGGDHQQAIAHYRAAAGRTTNIPERNYLMARAGRLASA
jgi:predicted RNA polymerase sigma factor